MAGWHVFLLLCFLSSARGFPSPLSKPLTSCRALGPRTRRTPRALNRLDVVNTEPSDGDGTNYAVSAEAEAEAQAEAQAQAKKEKQRQAMAAFAAKAAAKQRRNLLTAIGSAGLGAAAFAFERLQPVDAIGLLREAEASSMPLEQVGHPRPPGAAATRRHAPPRVLTPPNPQALATSKPVLVDFYADWCENCKVMAPRMAALEKQYASKVQFVTLNGADKENEKWVSAFKVSVAWSDQELIHPPTHTHTHTHTHTTLPWRLAWCPPFAGR